MRLVLALLMLALPAPALAAPVAGVYSEETASAMHRHAGFDSLRRPFTWRLMEPVRGRYEWGGYDAIVAGAARQGLTLLPFIIDAPDWAADIPAGEQRMRPPRDPADYARFAAAAVRRWGPDGTFWRTHPHLPYRPIRAWQVWNEPNLPAFWAPEPDPAAYAALLRATTAAIHAVDPGVTVVAAGLPDSQIGIPQLDYLRAMLRAGVAADALAVHAYAADAPGVIALVSRFRAVMGPRRALWVTEFGWATGGAESIFTVDERLQAELLAQSLYGLRKLARPLDLGGLFVFRWQDPAERFLPIDIWPYHGGLLRVDGSPKPAYTAYTTALRAAVADFAPTRLRARIGARGRVRCSRRCLAGLVLIETVPRPDRGPLQRVVARATRTLPSGRKRRPRLGVPLAGRTLQLSAVARDGAAARVSRSFPQRARP